MNLKQRAEINEVSRKLNSLRCHIKSIQNSKWEKQDTQALEIQAIRLEQQLKHLQRKYQ